MISRHVKALVFVISGITWDIFYVFVLVMSLGIFFAPEPVTQCCCEGSVTSESSVAEGRN